MRCFDVARRMKRQREWHRIMTRAHGHSHLARMHPRPIMHGAKEKWSNFRQHEVGHIRASQTRGRKSATRPEAWCGHAHETRTPPRLLHVSSWHCYWITHEPFLQNLSGNTAYN
jgi:hypothetical protein